MIFNVVLVAAVINPNGLISQEFSTGVAFVFFTEAVRRERAESEWKISFSWVSILTTLQQHVRSRLSQPLGTKTRYQLAGVYRVMDTQEAWRERKKLRVSQSDCQAQLNYER